MSPENEVGKMAIVDQARKNRGIVVPRSGKFGETWGTPNMNRPEYYDGRRRIKVADRKE